VAYAISPFLLHPGKNYDLSITSDQGSAQASLAAPGRGTIYNNTAYIFKDAYGIKEDIPVSIGLSATSRAYLIRLYIDCNVVVGQSTVHKRLEVPIGGDTTGNSQRFIYPTLTHRPVTNAPAFTFVYPHRMYLALAANISNQYGGFSLISATFILTQVETNLYSYYNVANGFRDAYSIREDQPDFSNIVGGFGMFGAMVEDSMVVDLQNH
jgi:hypothetical protein